MTILVVHNRRTEQPWDEPANGVSPFSFGVPVNDPDNSPDGALTLAWGNSWTSAHTGPTSGIGAVSTAPGTGHTWHGPQVDMAPDGADYQMTTLVKDNTQESGSPGWFTADVTIRNASGTLMFQRSKSLSFQDAGASKYAVGRLGVGSGTGDGFLRGDVAEVIVYLGVLSDRDRAKVEGYLAQKYARQPGSDFRYTGHYYHQRSKLHLAPYRAYDAELGRWISRDPMEHISGETPELAPDGPNLYGYVRSSPIMRFDPLGDQSGDSISSNPGTAAYALQSAMSSSEAAAAAEAVAAAAARKLAEQAAKQLLKECLSKPSQIAHRFGCSTKKVEKAIHAVKKKLSKDESKSNADVSVNPRTGEVYPQTPGGGLGDSIGNIFDFLR